ncbi:NUDIX hydrolase N-terminal domain-containing protein [Pseudokineococcus basanitobsidens]|uniref:NUDIX hydrolase N-terminal domain-containing protein n=1 Tax=Pseudokineococcus basanitobsidens TaxID=1926649 RepID=A0ABU8RN78_9ACTN
MSAVPDADADAALDAASDAGAGAPAPAERVRAVAVRLAALAQSGLAYTPTDYDRERFETARALAAELMAVLSGLPGDGAAELSLELERRDTGYATPKVDVRGVLVDEDERVLLMRERTDGRWSAPGGWADPGDTPSSAVLREVREETGHAAEVVGLVGCWDRETRGHRPSMSVDVVKLFFLCRATGDVRPPDELETLEIGWFGLDELPELSQGRTTRWELERCLAHHRDPSLPTELD